MLSLTIRSPHPTTIFAFVVVAMTTTTSLAASAFLTAQSGYAVEDRETDKYFTSHDALGTELASYGSDGLEIRDLTNGGIVVDNFGYAPSDYAGWNSFTTLDPSGDSIWVGFTTLYNTDDRIYEVSRSTGYWNPLAVLTGNIDMEFFGTTAYVVANPGAPIWAGESAIYRFDQTGSDNHELMADVGGFSAGLDFDSFGNLYYLPQSEPALVRFAANDVAAASSGDPLALADATTLASLPGGGYDVELDSADHVLFNVITGLSFVAMWNGIEGAGQNYSTLATESAGSNRWLQYLSVAGNLTQWDGGSLFANDYFFNGAAEIRLAWRPGDLNGDDFVGADDLDIVRAHWGETVTIGDLLAGDASRDGFIGADDLDIVRAYWGQSAPPPPGTVPEPTTLTLLLLGALGLLAWRRLRQ